MPKGIYKRKPMSKETKNRISKALMGHRNFTMGMIPWNKGKKGIQISYWKGKKRSLESIEKNRLSHLGKKASQETKDKQSETHKANGTGKWMKGRSGRLSPTYKHGLSSNPEYLSWIKNLWHKRNKKAEGSHSYLEWINLKEKCNFTCPCCGRKEPEIKLSVDHIIPLSNKGTNYINNIQPLCMSCNSKKHTNTINYLITLSEI